MSTVPPNQTTAGLGLTATVLAVSSLTVMSNATIAPSLPGLAAAFADTPGIVLLSGLVLSLPSLSILLSAALFGRLADRMDRKMLLMILLALYGVSGASAALADTMVGILISRVCLGLCVAGTMTIAMALAADFWTGPARARFMGWQAGAMSGGGILFLLFGGLMAEIDWRAPFLIYLASYPVLIAVAVFLPRRPPVSSPAPGSVGAVGDSAGLPRALLWRVASLSSFSMMMFYVVPTRLPFLLVENGISSPAAAGVAIAGLNAGGLVTALSFSRIRARLEPQSIFAAGFVLMGMGYGMIAWGGSYGFVIAGTLLAGLGMGSTLPNQSNWLMAAVPEALRGRAAGILTSAVFGGQLASPILSGALSTQLATSFVFVVFAGLLLVVATALMIDQRRHPSIAAI